MTDCQHKWKANSGSNDKPCIKCLGYPELRLRYQCTKCLQEQCRRCLIKMNIELPKEEIIPTQEQSDGKILGIAILKLQQENEQLRKDIDNLTELIVEKLV